MLQFETQINSVRSVTVPADIAAQIPDVQPVRVVLDVSEAGREDEWAQLTSEQFLGGYSDDDSIYDGLSAG